jgi:hypothetical protein
VAGVGRKILFSLQRITEIRGEEGCQFTMSLSIALLNETTDGTVVSDSDAETNPRRSMVFRAIRGDAFFENHAL